MVRTSHHLSYSGKQFLNNSDFNWSVCSNLVWKTSIHTEKISICLFSTPLQISWFVKHALAITFDGAVVHIASGTAVLRHELLVTYRHCQDRPEIELWSAAVIELTAEDVALFTAGPTARITAADWEACLIEADMRSNRQYSFVSLKCLVERLIE